MTETDIPREQIAVIGSGAFGTALAVVAAQSGKADVTLLCRDAALARHLGETRINAAHLPDVTLPEALQFSADRATVLAEATIVLMVTPSHTQAAVAEEIKPLVKPDQIIVTCAKGLASRNGGLLTEKLGTVLPGHAISVLSGPGFAADIASGLPTAMVVASADMAIAERLARAISGPGFRLYPSIDRVGVQLGGALKNVLAIACGIVEGAGLGHSARAALISRGLAEMTRLAVAQGADAGTLQGLSGLGDLVLTATSSQSRNYRFGLETGRTGRAHVPEAELVEGVAAATSAAQMARAMDVDMPITDAVAAILGGRLDVKTAIATLMTRPITTE